MKKLFIILLVAIIGFSCTNIRFSKHQVYRKMIDTSQVFKQATTGLMLYNISQQKTIYSKNAHKYFVPASNTKLFTLYSSLQLLKDSIPALKYIEEGDSITFWGTGDPTFLHPDFENKSTALDFLKSVGGKKKLYFSDGNFAGESQGKGWAWDDYNDYYAAEKSPLPMYGNFVRVRVDSGQINIQPSIFSNSFYKKDDGKIVQRTLNDNLFLLPKNLLQADKYRQDIPFKTSSALNQQLLMDTLKLYVGVSKKPVINTAKTIYSIPSDQLLSIMMQESDNMMAEHLLLLCGSNIDDSLDTEFAINYIQEKFLSDLPDKNKWVDGSGLSRYNLFTPRSIVKLLEKMYREFPEERLFSLLAVGGKSGTLKNSFNNEENPYIFAKTGSMSGVYNLSGYLKTKKGQTILFSFMNNNFNTSVSMQRKEVEKILKQVRNRE